MYHDRFCWRIPAILGVLSGQIPTPLQYDGLQGDLSTKRLGWFRQVWFGFFATSCLVILVGKSLEITQVWTFLAAETRNWQFLESTTWMSLIVDHSRYSTPGHRNPIKLLIYSKLRWFNNPKEYCGILSVEVGMEIYKKLWNQQPDATRKQTSEPKLQFIIAE